MLHIEQRGFCPHYARPLENASQIFHSVLGCLLETFNKILRSLTVQ